MTNSISCNLSWMNARGWNGKVCLVNVRTIESPQGRGSPWTAGRC